MEGSVGQMNETGPNSTDTDRLFHYTEPYQIVLIVLLYTLLLIMGVVGNLFVLITVKLEPKMRNATNLFICNLSFADLLYSLTVIPMNCINTITTRFIFGQIPCKLTPFIHGTTVSASSYTLTIIALDRYLAICQPLKRFMNSFRAKMIIIAIWICSMVLIAPLPFKFVYNEDRATCYETWVHGDMEKIYFFAIIFTLIFFAPLILIAVFYFSLAFHIYNRTKAIKTESIKTNLSDDKKTDASHFVRDTYSYVTANSSCKSRQVVMICSGGVNRNQTYKIVKMLVLVVVLFALLVSPLMILLAYYKFATGYSNILLNIFQMFCSMNSCVNPWIYFFYSKRYRSSFQKIFRCYSQNPYRSCSFMDKKIKSDERLSSIHTKFEPKNLAKVQSN